VGIKLSPCGGYNDMGFEKAATLETYSYLAQQLSSRGIAYIQWARWFALLDPEHRGTQFDIVAELAPFFKGANLGNGDYSAEEAADAITAGKVTSVVFGRPYLQVR
jgi:N-ethylmaleimide reductase